MPEWDESGSGRRTVAGREPSAACACGRNVPALADLACLPGGQWTGARCRSVGDRRPRVGDRSTGTGAHFDTDAAGRLGAGLRRGRTGRRRLVTGTVTDRQPARHSSPRSAGTCQTPALPLPFLQGEYTSIRGVLRNACRNSGRDCVGCL